MVYQPKIIRYKPNFIRPELLLHPNIPKPLHGVNPRSILGDSWWNDVRQKAYKENNYCCWACGISKQDAKYHQWLEAHESYDINYSIGEVTLSEIVALCHSCHNFIHNGRMEILVQKGEMEFPKFQNILRHGHMILTEYNLSPSDMPTVTTIAEWDKWHLILNGKSYYSPYKNMDDWYNHYNS